MTLVLIILSSCILIAGGIFFHPIISGDGNEYVGMTISFFNHASPDYLPLDAELKQKIYNANNVHLNVTNGYHPSLRGTLEASHLWFYSLFVLPFFYLFHSLSINELAAFQFFNIFLLILTILVIYRYDPVIKPKHFWYIAFLVSSPVLLYLHWTHTEVFSFCFVSLSIFFGFLSDNRNYYLSVLCSSLASLQNPPIAVLTGILVILGWRDHSYKLKNLLYLLLISSISSAPYLYSFYTFHTSNPQMYIGAASLAFISWDRIAGLFIDLNSGMLPYIPVILFISVMMVPYSLCIRHDSRIAIIWGITLGLAIASTTTLNWNCGIMYIFRYAVWILPLLMVIPALLSEYTTHYLVTFLLVIALISTGLITTGCLLDHRGDNYLTFNKFSKEVMVIYPGLYDPNYEIFGERVIYDESSFENAFPMMVTNGQDIRKILTNEQNLDLLRGMNITISPRELHEITLNGRGYINSEPNLSLIHTKENCIHVFGKNRGVLDIFDPNIQYIEYSSGWARQVFENGSYIRWMEGNGNLAIYTTQDEDKQLKFQAKSNIKNQSLELYIGEIFIHKWEMNNQISDYLVNISLKKGFNVIQLSAPNSAISGTWRTMERYPIIGFQNISLS
ncbi:MAG: hypothetical protein LUQ50_11105 [Methanospirillum sp.]|nr:hypothetical protein [Methanospirillum sp.]